MSLDAAGRAEMMELLDCACSGQLVEAQSAHLQHLLLDNAEARAMYIDYMVLHAGIAWRFRDRDDGIASPAARDKALDGWRAPPVRYVAAAIVLLAAIVPCTVWLARSLDRGAGRGKQAGHPQSEPGSAVASPAPSPLPSVASFAPVARFARAVDIRWGKGAEPPIVGGDLVAGQQIRMESGLAEIVCADGVELVLQGPASLTMESGRSVFLAEGRLTARITRPAARGFTVRTPESVAVDEGTEFGVDVAPGGDQNIHVFKGKVQFSATSKNGGPIAQRQLTENQGARMRAETQGVNLVADAGEGFTRSIDGRGHDPRTVAYWRFEDQPVGTLVPDSGGGHKPVRGTIDCSGNGNDLFTWSPATAPRFSADVPAVAVARTGMADRGSLDNSAPLSSVGSRDLYTKSLFSHASPLDLQRITPRQWTIEASVKPARLRRAEQVFVGRDGSEPFSGKKLASRLALSIDPDDHFAVRFIDVEGRSWAAVADGPRVQPGRWYHVAATSNGRRLQLYVDANDGRGYRLRAGTALAAAGDTSLGSGGDAAEWSIGRGKSADAKPVAWFQGWIDEVRISDIARTPAEFLFAAPAVAKTQGKTEGRQ